MEQSFRGYMPSLPTINKIMLLYWSNLHVCLIYIHVNQRWKVNITLSRMCPIGNEVRAFKCIGMVLFRAVTSGALKPCVSVENFQPYACTPWSCLPCTIAAAIAADCPEGFVDHAGTCYFFSHGLESWTGAFVRCFIIPVFSLFSSSSRIEHLTV